MLRNALEQVAVLRLLNLRPQLVSEYSKFLNIRLGMLKEDDLLAYLELFKQNPLTDTQKKFLMSARRGEFLLNIDSKNRLRIWIRATELEREMMGEE